MTDRATDHPGADPDLVEAYVLGRLAKEIRKSLEEHSASCASCRRAIDAELDLAAAAKRAGRENLKARLRARIVPPSRTRLPWGAITAAAAVMVILVGVGIVNRWFTATPPTAETTLSDRLTSSEEPAVPSGSAGEGAPSQRRDERSLLKEGVARKPSLSRLPESAGGTGQRAKGKTFESDDAAIPRAPSLAAQKVRDAGEVPPVTWVEGNIVVGQEAERHAKEEKAMTNAARNMREPAEQAKDISRGELLSRTSTPIPAQQYTINQRKRAEIIGGGKKAQGTPRQQAVQLMVREDSDTTRITLFLDTLLDAATLRSASVESVGPDSLVVHLPDRSIGFRLQSQRKVMQQTR